MIDYVHPERESSHPASRAEVADTLAQLRRELLEHQHGDNWGGFFGGQTSRQLDEKAGS